MKSSTSLTFFLFLSCAGVVVFFFGSSAAFVRERIYKNTRSNRLFLIKSLPFLLSNNQCESKRKACSYDEFVLLTIDEIICYATPPEYSLSIDVVFTFDGFSSVDDIFHSLFYSTG